MRKHVMLALLALSAAAMPALAQEAVSRPVIPQPVQDVEVVSLPGRYANYSVTRITAVVEAIDAPNRKLTLKTADGQKSEVVAGEEVRNFAQIEVGDELHVECVRNVLMELKTGERQKLLTEESIVGDRAKPGEKPGGVYAHRIAMLTDVVGVDKEAKTITLKDKNGKHIVLNVRNPAHFDVVKVGSQVEIVYVEGFAIDVIHASKKASKK